MPTASGYAAEEVDGLRAVRFYFSAANFAMASTSVEGKLTTPRTTATGTPTTTPTIATPLRRLAEEIAYFISCTEFEAGRSLPIPVAPIDRRL